MCHSLLNDYTRLCIKVKSRDTFLYIIDDKYTDLIMSVESYRRNVP